MPPSSVDAGGDHAGARWMAFYWAWSWAWAVYLVTAFLPSLFGVPTLEPWLLIALFVAGPAVMLLALQRWRKIRRTTGYPVIGELAEVVDVGAALFQYYDELFQADLSGLPTRERVQMARSRRKAQRGMRTVRNQMLIQTETAALGERWGWDWLRRRSTAKVTKVVAQMWRSYEAARASRDDEQNPADGSSDGASPADRPNSADG